MATLKDVAALAGVGMATASRVISGKGPVSADAVARVQAAIEALNFRPSSIGRAMATQSLGMIGIYVPTYLSSFYGTILKQTDIELRAADRHVVVATGSGASPREQAIDAVRFLIGRDCDGLVVVGHALSDEDLMMLHGMHPRIAFLNRMFERMPEVSFCVDHHHGGVLAARTLLAHGHRRFAVIAGPFVASDNRARIDGFFDELARNGIERGDVALIESDFGPQGGHAAAQALLESKHRFTALFCANDMMAMGALACLQQAGVSVPRDVSVLGYDDDYLAAYVTPGLSSVHIPIIEMTQNAVRWLTNECYGDFGSRPEHLGCCAWWVEVHSR